MIVKIILLLLVSAVVNAAETEMKYDADKKQNSSIFINQKMQECLSLVDQRVVKLFMAKGENLNETVKSLCENNERNAAQNKAVGFALEIQKSKDLSILKQCSKIMEQDTSIVMQMTKKYFISDLRYKHICDYDRP